MCDVACTGNTHVYVYEFIGMFVQFYACLYKFIFMFVNILICMFDDVAYIGKHTCMCMYVYLYVCL